MRLQAKLLSKSYILTHKCCHSFKYTYIYMFVRTHMPAGTHACTQRPQCYSECKRQSRRKTCNVDVSTKYCSETNDTLIHFCAYKTNQLHENIINDSMFTGEKSLATLYDRSPRGQTFDPCKQTWLLCLERPVITD